VAARVDSSLDSIEIEGGWIYDRWVIENSHIFKNLENYPDSGYGWYQLKVWSRDDAFVSSVNPAKTFLRILKPLFRFEEPSRKTILVLDHTIYGGDGAAATPTDVLPFYYNAFSQTADLWDNWEIWLPVRPSSGIERHNNIRFGLMLMPGVQEQEEVRAEDVLSRHDLTIVLNLGKDPGVDPNWYAIYMNYLDVGGRLWVIGLNNYGMGGQRVKQCLEEKKGSAPFTFEVGTEYLGVECIFFPAYGPAYPQTLEFIGAEPFGSWELPLLEMDPDKVESLGNYNSTSEGRNYRKNGIPHVPYDFLTDYDFKKRSPLQRRLYSFVSRFGPESEMEGFPCATTYIGPTFRTAEFSFPLNLMKDGDEKKPGALEAFRKMVEWFWKD
jgi:hypothetical protein